MEKETVHDGFVLPHEEKTAPRQHRDYDLIVDGETETWLRHIGEKTNMAFVSLGQVGFVMRGDGPKAILAAASETRDTLPKVINETGEELREKLNPEALDRRERIAQRLAGVICNRFLEFPDLSRLVTEGMNFTFPPELIADIGLQRTRIPSMAPGAGHGWLKTSQPSHYPRTRWLDKLLHLVYEKVQRFLLDQWKVQSGSFRIHGGHYGEHASHHDHHCTTFDLLQKDLEALILDGLRVKINDEKILEVSLKLHPIALSDKYRESNPERLGFPKPSSAEWITSPLIVWKSPKEVAA